MPVYEYACDKCGHEFEREQRITEPPVKTCPHCRARRVRRLISRTAFVLKGGGWYSDLYSSAKPDAKSAEDSSARSESGASDAKPESSPEPKAEPKPAAKDRSKSKKKSKAAA
jgi:putative FmdB family regulatory protein